MSANEVHSNQSALGSDDSGSLHIRRSLARPRPRPVLSCLRCRSRKIKCDRLLPCKQCTLTGHDRLCSYSVRPKAELSGSQSQNGSASVPAFIDSSVVVAGDFSFPALTSSTQPEGSPQKTETLISLQQRLQRLGRLCETHSSAPVKTSSHEKGKSDSDLPKVDAELSIKASGPRYHSQSYKKSLLHHFGVAGRFIHNGFDDPKRASVMNELRKFHEKYSKARKKSDRAKPAHNRPSLFDLLPTQAACDEAVGSYFRAFERGLRILHYPSFMEECRRFWSSAEDQREEFSALVAQLVTLLAIVHALETASFSGVERDNRVVLFCGRVEAWLESLSGRKQLTIATLRTKALLILAQQVRATQADELWKATGSLMRSAMMAGLHRDPSEFPDIPIFEGELRRRLWMTIVEMDLGTSLINGMPVMLHFGDFTCGPPSNLDDLDLFDNMTELPESKSLEEVTESMFQVALAESLPLRLRAMSLSATQLGNVEELIHALERHIRQLPSNLAPEDGRNEDFGQLLGTVMINVHIRRVLSHLYRSSISWSDFATGQTAAGLQSSLAVLSYQKFFDPDTLGSKPDDREKYWNLFHILGRNDIMQAALDVCLYVQVPGLVSWTKASLLLAIDDTISSLMRRISRNGSDIKDITRLSVISQLLKSQFTQGDSEDMMKEGTQSVLMACRRAAGQEDLLSKETDNRKHTHIPSSRNTQLSHEEGAASMDWSIMGPDPSLANNDLVPYMDPDDANFNFLSDDAVADSFGGLWNQY